MELSEIEQLKIRYETVLTRAKETENLPFHIQSIHNLISWIGFCNQNEENQLYSNLKYFEKILNITIDNI